MIARLCASIVLRARIAPPIMLQSWSNWPPLLKTLVLHHTAPSGCFWPATIPHTHTHQFWFKENSAKFIFVWLLWQKFTKKFPVFSCSIWCHWRATSQEACWHKRRVGKATRAEGQGDCAEGEGDGVKRAAAQTWPAKVWSRRAGKKGIAEIPHG